MIYNLHEYLENMTTEKIYSNVKQITFPDKSVPDRIVLIQERGAVKKAWLRYTEQSIQVMCRDIDNVKARELAYTIYELLDNRFGLVLPAVTVGTVIYPEFKTAQITASSTPQTLGVDESGRSEFTFDLQFIFNEDENG